MEKPLIKANVNLIEKTNSKNISFEPQYKMDSLSQKTISSIGFGNSKITNFQKIIKLKKGFCEKYVKIIVVISIICVLVVYVAILIYQLTVIENIFNIFFAFYANYIQRDKLINLHTSISSGFFVFLKLGNYSTIIDNDYFYLDFVLQKAQEFSKSYHIFYQNYIKYRFALGKDLSPFYVDYNFTKIRISWEEYTTQNNYLDESEVMVYNVIISCLGDITHFINNDFNLFFNSNYKRAQNTLLDSLYGNLFFYFSKNLQETFLVFFSNIQEEIDKAENDYTKKNKITSTIIEVVGFLLNLITFISCIYFLRKSNINLYNSIINLFIDFTQEGNYSLKNSYDNFSMAEKLTRLKFLLNNFSVKAIDKFNKKITYGVINNNDLEDIDNNNDNNDNNLSLNSKESKQNKQGSLKKKKTESKKKKGINKNTKC